MLTVGIKELKAKLSNYVGKAGRGEEIVVTARGKEIALIVPITKERRALKHLSETGEARMPKGKPAGVSGLRIRGKSLAQTVLESRR
ncbi:MAG: type II toxin-antitoxin system prevent-host-death family antitoxin [Deltaproteobacteria bacterium]|nr:type II toxin-antitoxin system prevent-host-death family antitoxin [Deltaproteobacteria bacterium]